MTYLYQISKPGKTDPSTPVLVTLHGMGTDYHDLASIAADGEKNFVQINIQGDLTFSSGYTYYIPDFTAQSEKRVITGTMAKLEHALADIYQKEGLSSRQPLFFLGFSQGAILSLSYALLHPDTAAGAVVLSGRLPDFFQSETITCSQEPKPAFFIGHGRFDPLFPVEKGRSIDRFLRESGLDADYHDYPTGHSVTETEVDDLRNWIADHFHSRKKQ
ncbi:alpha/beta hydrolase [Sporolactobacillus vineae]|uniref:alpha/beta hydrolase n=1 Tax=Sporolactobacillus vineae TaxID=444463 RepID=UPI000289771E|nr:alpha/beta fold hydrolase [Sporolactobacillus vineae]